MNYEFENTYSFIEAFTSGVGLVIVLALAALSLIAGAIVFKKAGEHPLWVIVPIANIYKLFKIAWGEGWMFLATLVPIVNIVIGIMLNLKLAKSFGKSTLFGVGLIFFPYIFMMILAFSSAEYIGPNGERRL